MDMAETVTTDSAQNDAAGDQLECGVFHCAALIEGASEARAAGEESDSSGHALAKATNSCVGIDMENVYDSVCAEAAIQFSPQLSARAGAPRQIPGVACTRQEQKWPRVPPERRGWLCSHNDADFVVPQHGRNCWSGDAAMPATEPIEW